MHLLMIAPEQIAVPPPKGGSVEISMLAIAERLSLEHQVTLLSRKYAHYPHITTNGNLKIVRVPASDPKHYIRAVMAYIRGKHYDWIQIDNRPRFVTPVRKCFPHTPISVFLHSLTFVSKPMIVPSIAEIHLKKADTIIANSSSLLDELLERFPGLSHKIKQVYLGVDLHQFRPPTSAERDHLRKKYGLRGAFVFAFAGRIIPRKGLPVLMKALSKVRKKVPNVKLVIAGRGKAGYMAQIKSKAHRLRISAKFIGYKSHRSMHEVYAMADCFVCPSQKHEAFGLVNIEAMASGIPVIASQIGGISEAVHHGGNGLLIKDYRNARSFADSMLRLARDRAYTASLGIQARNDMEQQFSWANTAQSLCDLYINPCVERGGDVGNAEICNE
jgi:spore coat protein SA